MSLSIQANNRRNGVRSAFPTRQRRGHFPPRRFPRRLFNPAAGALPASGFAARYLRASAEPRHKPVPHHPVCGRPAGWIIHCNGRSPECPAISERLTFNMRLMRQFSRRSGRCCRQGAPAAIAFHPAAATLRAVQSGRMPSSVSPSLRGPTSCALKRTAGEEALKTRRFSPGRSSSGFWNCPTR